MKTLRPLHSLRPLRFIFLSISILFIVSCASNNATVVEAPRQANKTVFTAPANADKLNTTIFEGIPAEARNYLQLLSQAFRNSDTEFILAQGEGQFEKEVKNRYDDAAYFALLYRTGAYAAEAPRENVENPRINFREIIRIEYLRWEEDGPMLEINGQLVTKKGEIIPCKLILAWRLKEPKILGMYP
ncbi:MAG: hypothetical protein LBN21_13540 [Treponema sp.]|nr:hypothetical protein [Treponema sp.]